MNERTTESENTNRGEKIGEIVRIYRRGRIWWVNYQLDGTQHRRSLRTTSKKQAQIKAIRIEAEMLEGLHRPGSSPPSVEAVVEAYMTFTRTERRRTKTVQKYEATLKSVVALANELNRKNILGIDLGFIDEFRSRRAVLGRAAKTMYTETVIIRQLINFALSRRLIENDPLSGLKIKEPRQRLQPCWTPAEVAKIIAGSKPPQGSIFALLADTGLRIGELEWLSWDDVDLPNNEIVIQPKEGWDPKSGDQRRVPMTARVRQLLNDLPRRCRWVFPAPKSTRYPTGDHRVSARRLLVYLKRVLEKLKLRGHLHTFRHAFISNALTRGIPEAVVRAWVGHVDRDVIRQYTHVADSISQQQMQRLSDLHVPSGDGRTGENGPPAGTESTNAESAQTQHTRPTEQDDEVSA
jgi:integrase